MKLLLVSIIFITLLLLPLVNSEIVGVNIGNTTITGVVISPPVTSIAASNVTTFLNLTDTPASYSGSSALCVKVNIGETGLEFSTCAAGFVQNNTRGIILNFTKIFSGDWSNITITESQITDLVHTTDTNASTVCSTDEVLLGNGSCRTSSDFQAAATFDNIAFVNNSVADGQVFLVDQAVDNDTRLNFRGNITNDTYFFYNTTNGTLWLVVNGILQQNWGSSTTIFQQLNVNNNTVLQNLQVQDVSGDEVNLTVNLNVVGNTTSTIFFGNGSGLTDVCLSNGTNCANVTGLFNNTQKNTAGPFLFNDSITIFFNDTRLNETIILTGGVFNDTNLILSVNTTANIEALGFVTGAHTIDTNASTVCSTDEVLLGNGSCATTSVFGVAVNLTNVAFTNESNTFDLNQTFSQDITVAGIFATFFNWIEDSIYLTFNGFTLSFNETQLNSTIDDRISISNTTDTQKNAAGPFLFNDSITIFFNDTRLNETIILTGAIFNDTTLILSVNTTSNIESLNFSTGPHTTDTDTQKIGGSPYLFNDTTTIFVDDTFLNTTIDNRISISNTTDTQKDTSGPFLFNDSTTIFFNATLLNDTIILVGSIFNDTDVILSVNTTSNIEALNFTTGPHTVDTDTDTNASTACSGAEVLLGNGSCESISQFGIAPNFTNVAFVNESNNFTVNQTFTGIFATFFNWIEDSIYLTFDGFTLSFNESQLNTTIDDRISISNTTDTQKTTSPTDPYLFNDTTTILFNESFLNGTIDNRLGVANLTDTQKDTFGRFLFNDSTTIFFNESELNITINQSRFWAKIGSALFPKVLSDLVGLGTSTPNATLDIFSERENFSLTECLNPGVMCYRFEAGSRDLAIDTSLIFNLGIISGATRTNSSGLNGTGNVSLSFLGEDFVHAPGIVENEFTEGFSLAAWVNVTSKGTNYIISKFTNVTDGYSLHLENDERLYFTVQRGGTLFQERTPPAGTILQGTGWHHVAAVFFDNGTQDLYIDGAPQAGASHVKSIAVGSNDLFIGIRSDITGGFVGFLDEVALVNLSANASAVADIAKNGFNLVPRNITKSKNVSFAISAEVFGDIFIVDEFGRVGISVSEPSLTFEVNNTARFFGDIVAEQDIFLGGVLVGGSPVKIVGGLDVGGEDIENAKRIFSNNITSDNAVTAVQFIDLTPAYDKSAGEALTELLDIRNQSDGRGGREINHSTIPDFARVNTEIRNVTSGEKENVIGRSIGNIVSMIIEAIRSLKSEDDTIKAELCRKDNTYAWC